MLTSFSLSLAGWSRFWRPGVTNVGGSNINYIQPPDTGAIPFTAVLFIAAAVVFGAILFFRRKGLSRGAIFKSLIQASILATLISAFRMDYNWAALYENYSRRLAGKDVGARIVELHGNRFFDFMKSVQRDIPEGGAVRLLDIDVNKNPLGYYITLKGNYYLLPVMTSKNGGFIWAHPGVQGFTYNAATSTLQVAGSLFRARLYKYYKGGGALFEIFDGGAGR